MDSNNIKSTSGYIFIYEGAIFLRSNKHAIISRNSMEAELIILSTTYAEAKWIRNLIVDILIISKLFPTLPIHSDSKAVIELLK